MLAVQVLHFQGYFQQRVFGSPYETERVRPMALYYYLEDDSACIMEPRVENSGLVQGKLVKRQRLAKNERGEPYHWKELNLAQDLTVFGVVYRITDCDAFTRVNRALTVSLFCLYNRLCVCVCVYLSACVSTCLSGCLSACLSHCSVCLAVCLYYTSNSNG